MRVPFVAMSCVASLSLVRAPSRATTSMHRAPRAVCSAPDALVDRGGIGCICSAVVTGGAGDLQSRWAPRGSGDSGHGR